MIPEPFYCRAKERRLFEHECKERGVDVKFEPIGVNYEVHILGELETNDFAKIVWMVAYQSALADVLCRIQKKVEDLGL